MIKNNFRWRKIIQQIKPQKMKIQRLCRYVVHIGQIKSKTGVSDSVSI